MSIQAHASGMHTSRKIALGLTVALLLWLAWCIKGSGSVAVTTAESLPPGFIWGVSSSAFQSEGGALDSEWSRWNAANPKLDRYGTSVDFRHRYREDVALAHDLGVNTYRIGINWARVEPPQGQIDQDELAYYDDLMFALKQAGIAPLITLDHLDFPGWVTDQGGWTNPKTTAEFVNYASLIVKRYHQDVHLWITFNEAAFYIAGEAGIHKLSWHDIGLVRDNVVAAHLQVYDLIHGLDAGAMVTSNIGWMGDHFGSRPINALDDWLFLDRVADKCDVIAIDYYAANMLQVMRTGEHWNWPPEPVGLYRTLKLLQARYPDKPMLVAETGMATRDGQPRADGVKREDVL